jgi:superoxide reductase
VQPFNELYQAADWKKEKHVPLIECNDTVKANEIFSIKASIGKEVAHPNTTEHHINWIDLYFLPEGGKFPYQIGHCAFCAHGASVDGADTSTIYIHHEVAVSMKTAKAGTLYATSLCNIHGLWMSEKEISLS